MHVFGQFPNQEDFCLVVCHVCNQVVKAQGILTHYGKNPNTYTLPTTQTHYSKNPNTLALRTTLTLTLPLQYKPPWPWHMTQTHYGKTPNSNPLQ